MIPQGLIAAVVVIGIIALIAAGLDWLFAHPIVLLFGFAIIAGIVTLVIMSKRQKRVANRV
jgi:Flp pilus assembly protein TadB